jgi:two-component system CheB/CheR fusion protein
LAKARKEHTTKKTTRSKTTKTQRDLHVVAIGASAGGLEAIHTFFDNMPSSDSLAFIIIQHLSPNHKSLLAELVAKHTSMQVFEVKDNMPVEPGCIYIIPPKKLMTIKNCVLELSDKSTTDQAPNTAIDIFLQSLAADQKEKSIAVILSGTGTDGSRGVELVKEENGLVLIQDPESAKFDGMPRSAISKGVGDLVLPPEKMPAEIINYITGDDDTEDDITIDADTLKTILELVSRTTGSDFTNYKLPTIHRRINRRVFITKSNSTADYVDLLQKDAEEVQILSKEFLIGVTKFFRDKEAFKIIETEVLPPIIADKADGDTIKVWINACSTGEEAYSLAILVHQQIKRSGKDIKIRIFATDIDEVSVASASRGTYPLTVEKDIDTKLFDTYFTVSGKYCTVIPELRKLIVFAKHDLRKDPPFIKNDLISCRNMLIYMDSKLQHKILNTFDFSLNPGGYLFLGPSESMPAQFESIEEINKRWKIFKKNKNATTVSRKDNTPTSFSRGYNLFNSIQKEEKGNTSLDEDFKQVLLENHNYAAFYIDKQFDVKEATGSFRSYLSLSDKVTNLNVLKMIDTSLSAILNSTIRKSWKKNGKVTVSNTVTGKDGKDQKYTITVKPAGDDMTIIVLGKDTISHNIITNTGNHDNDSTELIQELDNELKETRQHLQTAIEEAETANEELQSSNEELLSANEELQSSNEELQSINEELHTLNTEHQLKIAELIELNDDLNNYFGSTDIGQVFLDRKLRIRKYNPAAVKFVNLIESDINRPFSHISNNLGYDLNKSLESVLNNGKVIEKEITTEHDRTSLMRILPYLRQGKKIDGVVISFIDISVAKELTNIISGIFNATQDVILALKTVRDNHNNIVDFRISAANRAAEVLYGDNLINRSLIEIDSQIENNGLFKKFVQVIQTGKSLKATINHKQQGNTTWQEVIGAKTDNGLAISYRDITEKKEAEDRIRNSYNELNVTKNKLKDLNNELENIIGERTRKLTESDERFRLISMATNDALWDWDLVNNTIWWSDAFHNMFGYDASNVEYNIDFLFNKIHPDEKEKIKKSIYSNLNKGKKQWSAEYLFTKADGSYAVVLNRCYILHDDNDIPYRMLGSMMDITSLREAEMEIMKNIEQREFLADSIPLIVWTTDAEGEITFINKNFEAYTGAAPDELDINKYTSKEQIPQIREELEAARTNNSNFNIEVKLRRHDGEYRWHLLRASAKEDNEGKILMWVGTYTDIHEQKAATETMERMVQERTRELQTSNKALESTNHDLQQFASVASHDLKEPLRKIHLFSNILKDRYMEKLGGGGDYLERIISSSSRMTKLINDLLSFSRLSVSNLFEPVDLNSLISDILADLELAISEKQAEINIPDFPMIDAVPGQMRQVFQNMISNALKFTDSKRKAVINIKAERVVAKEFEAQTSDNGEFCRISIQDNGIGFDEKYLDKIFTIFQRLHSKQDYEGTGIGLAICKKIVDKHNGIITAKSIEGVGATFIIVLPIKQDELVEG